MKKFLFFLVLFLSAKMSSQSSITVEENTILAAGDGTDICANSKTIAGTLSGTGTWCEGVLPVELVSFAGRRDKNDMLLEWNTATEIENYGFEIHFRPSSAEEWSSIGFVSGHGNSNIPWFYSFRHVNAPEGRVQYRLKQIDRNGTVKYSQVINVAIRNDINFSLEVNYPNPFNPSTVINYSIASASHVSLKVYTLLGSEVAELVHEYKEPGTYAAVFNASALANGVYFYKLEAGQFADMKKLTVIK